jgi:hypothetical protein
MRCFPFQVVWSCQRVKLSHFSTAAQSELFDTDSESDPAQSQQMPALSSPRPPQSAGAVYVRTRPQRGLAGVFAFAAPEVGTSPMTSLADLLDPDQWMVSGKNLLDFRWPDGNNEREAVKLILSTRPLLRAHFERWSKRVMVAVR